MRNMEDRLAEIHRRSDEIIQKRKTRRTALMACMPLMLCLVLVAALLLPDGMSVPTSGENKMPGGTREELHHETQAAMGVFVPTIRQIHVEGCGFSITHSETEDLMNISDLLKTLTVEASLPGSAEYNLPNPAYTGATTTVGRNDKMMGYTICLISESGTARYYLLGSVLKNTQDGSIYLLEEKELFALKDALGIPLY